MGGGNDTLLVVQVEQFRVELIGLREAFNQNVQEMKERIETSMCDAIALLDSIKVRLNALDGDVTLVKYATINVGGMSKGGTAQKIKVPEPKPFQGKRNAKSKRTSCGIWSNTSRLFILSKMRWWP